MKSELELLAIIFCAVMVLISIISFAEGAQKASANDSCKYQRVAEYYPAYWLGCELFEKRWEE